MEGSHTNKYLARSRSSAMRAICLSLVGEVAAEPSKLAILFSIHAL